MLNLKLSSYKFIFKIIYWINRLFSLLKNNIEIKKSLYELNKEDQDKNDIYVSTYMKSGTTWVQMILYQLTSNGEMHFKHIYEVSPWIEQYLTPYRKVDINTEPRIFKTHLKYNYFPKRFSGKFICVIRNGMDVAVSQFHHSKDWGSPDLTFKESFNNHFVTSWFKYSKEWLENKNRHKILYVKYEDLKENIEKEVLRIAEFCKINIEKKDLNRILYRSSFEFMKIHEDKFGMETYKFNHKNFIRKGKINSSSSYFSNKELNDYKTEFEKYLSNISYVDEYRLE